MTNEDFYILHLSDLHIRNEQNTVTGDGFYSTSLKRLLNDIENQTKNRDNIIVVVSGDLIDQGNYEKHQAVSGLSIKQFYENMIYGDLLKEWQ